MNCHCESVLPRNSQVTSRCLRNISIFGGISDEDFENLRHIGMRKNFRHGQALFLQGEPVNEVFIIKSGRIRLSKVLEDGTEITLDFRKPGDLIGEDALSGPIDYPLTAWAMEETVTCGFYLKDFNRLILDNPELGLKLIGNMSKRILTLTGRLESAAAENLDARLLRALTDIAWEHGKNTSKGLTIDFPLTHEELSYLVGAHRVSVTKALKRLQNKGKLLKDEKRFILLPELLRE